MKPLEHLLGENYDDLQSPLCREWVISYIRHTPSMEGESVKTIKGLTKVAHHILGSDPAALDGLVPRLYQFCVEGVMALGRDETNGTQREGILESHLYAHAGAFAKHQFLKTRNPHWLEHAYVMARLSAEAAEVADPVHAAYSNRVAGEHAELLYTVTADEKWLREEITHHRSSATAWEFYDPETAVQQYRAAVFAANRLQEVTGENLDQEVYRDLARAADSTQNVNLNITLRRAACTVLKRIRGGDGDRRWDIETYNQNIKLAGLLEVGQATGIAFAFFFAGDAAERLAKKARDVEWAQRGIDAYLKGLGSYERERDTRMQNLVIRMRVGIHELGRISPRMAPVAHLVR